VFLRPDCSRIRFLDHPIFVWLGDVSYSFYCYAMSVLILVAWALLTILPRSFAVSDLGSTMIVLACVFFCVTISLLLARISFMRIEIPSIATGRSWSRRIEFGGRREARS
jgi:peptidoglycan/LPS O-acetylase OafA/YrhL